MSSSSMMPENQVHTNQAEMAAQQESSRMQQLTDSCKQVLGRGALALSLAAGAGVATGTAMEMADPHPSVAAADTGGYPDWDKICVAPGDPQAGQSTGPAGTLWCDGYQWGYYTRNPQGQITGNVQNSPRGYGYRNCTDWAAWRAQQLGVGTVPGNWANGKNWDDAALAAGKTVDATPEPGDIAVWNAGDFGHVAVVESVNSNGTVNVSEYNKLQDGTYGTRLGVTADDYIDLNGTGVGISGQTITPTINAHPTADLNKDGNDDLLLITHDGDGAVGANPGLSTNNGFWFQPEWWHDPYTDFGPIVPFVGDVTGEGRADLVYMVPTATGTQAWVLPSTGNGLQSPQLWWNGAGYMQNGIKAAIGDINADGTDDLLLMTKQGATGIALSPLLSTGSGFWLQQPWQTDNTTNWDRTTLLAGDVNGDGAVDPTLLVATPNGTDAWVQLSNKTGLGGPQKWWTGTGYQYDGIKPTMGDIDGNGNEDLILATKQADNGTAISPALSTGAGFWLQPPWWNDTYTDWNTMTPTAGNFTGHKNGQKPIADVGFVAPGPNGSVRVWVLPSTKTGLNNPQLWAGLNGWAYPGVKVAKHD